jgi:hypothetical protein
MAKAIVAVKPGRHPTKIPKVTPVVIKKKLKGSKI